MLLIYSIFVNAGFTQSVGLIYSIFVNAAFEESFSFTAYLLMLALRRVNLWDIYSIFVNAALRRVIIYSIFVDACFTFSQSMLLIYNIFSFTVFPQLQTVCFTIIISFT